MKYKYSYSNELPDLPIHYYATNYQRWEVSANPEELIHSMKRSDSDFCLYLVKLDIKEPYQIKNAIPNLADEQMEYLGSWMKVKGLMVRIN